MENTANQNTGKPLYTRRYYCLAVVRCIECVGHCIFKARYKIVMQHFLMVNHGISYLPLVFFCYIHTRLKARVGSVTGVTVLFVEVQEG